MIFQYSLHLVLEKEPQLNVCGELITLKIESLGIVEDIGLQSPSSEEDRFLHCMTEIAKPFKATWGRECCLPEAPKDNDPFPSSLLSWMWWHQNKAAVPFGPSLLSVALTLLPPLRPPSCFEQQVPSPFLLVL